MTKDDLLYLQIKPRLVDFLKIAGVPYWEPSLTVCPHCGEHAGILMDFMWRCSHCKEQGDVVDYVMALEHMETRPAAIKRICRALHIKVTTLEVISAGELLEMQFENVGALVDGFIGRGVYLLAGASKIGKSWLTLYIAHRISLGKDVWEFSVRQCDVLYLCLEDSRQEMQNRLAQISNGETGNVFFATEAELVGKGFEEQIAGFLIEHPTVKFVVIDTLQKIRQLRAEQYSYANDYDIIGQIKSIANRFGITILIVHHTRKAEADDPINAVSGTTGLTGASDGILVLKKDDRTEYDATLFLTGRDVADKQLRLRFEYDLGLWQFCGYGNEKTNACDRLFWAIDSMLEEKGEFTGTASTLLSLLSNYGELKITSPNALTRLLNSNRLTLAYELGVSYTTTRTASERLICLTRADDIFQN